jgi:transposase
MTKRADQLHHDNAPAHSTAVVQAFLAKHHITQLCQPPYSPDLALCDFAFPKVKIAVQREEICECDDHTVQKLSQRRLTAD